MTKINEALQNLGLTEKQAIIYTNLLQLGKTTAYKIAQKSGLKRPTVYVILDELRLKGLVTKIPYPKKQIYTAKHPKEFIQEVQDKLNKAVSTLPELLALTKSEDKPSVMYFDGVNGIQELLNSGLDKLENNELVGFYAHIEDIKDDVIKIFEGYNRKLKNMKIAVRGIAPEHQSLKLYREKDAEYHRNVKIVPFNTYSSDISIDIGPDFVRILMFKNLQGILIENKSLALAMKQIFEMQWSNS